MIILVTLCFNYKLEILVFIFASFNMIILSIDVSLRPLCYIMEYILVLTTF